ncbi:hypothetical protein [Chryseobacterium terrae]|uniref:Histidine kinase-, DNA gyrase B-, and HSP90-like ATPase n=1 Tax=Chryseobacterium terrae TaxID=3163299 RepID=A0ABW8Y189_9FLAO
MITSHHLAFEHTAIATVDADRNKVEQVLITFINNAVKYSPTDTVIQVKFYRRWFCPHRRKRSGHGTPEKDQGFIFDRFTGLKVML